jgi:hypothetical protein
MDMYLRVRVLFTIILGLGVSRLLGAVARIVQHPKEYKVSPILNKPTWFSNCN